MRYWYCSLLIAVSGCGSSSSDGIFTPSGTPAIKFAIHRAEASEVEGGFTISDSEFPERKAHVNPPELSNADIAETRARKESDGEAWEVQITLSANGRDKLAQLTKNLLGGNLVLFVGESVHVVRVSAPAVDGFIPLRDGYTAEAATRMARGLVRPLD